MDILKELKKIIAEILDIDETEIEQDTYLIRDLKMESIDLLELAVSINAKFKIDIDEDIAFLKNLRFHLKDIKDKNISEEEYLITTYPHLDRTRIKEILKDLDGGPVLKLKDIISYIEHYYLTLTVEKLKN